MRLLLLGVLVAGLGARPARAGTPGTVGAEFLTIEQGARAIGMGGAFAAVADDAGALWWNPAGLGRAQFAEYTLSHTAFIENVSAEYLGYVRPYAPLGGAFGASLTYLSVPGIEGTDALGASTGKIKAGGYVGAVSFGTEISSTGVTIGATGKYISQTLGTNSGTGFAADAGAQYRNEDWGLGVSVQNLGPSFKIGDVADPLPQILRGGAFCKIWDRRMTLSAEQERPYNDAAVTHFGAEWLLRDGLRLRGGVVRRPELGGGAGVSAGFGLAGAYGGDSGEKNPEADAFKPFWERAAAASGRDFKTAVKQGAVIIGIDYAFVSYGDLDTVHRVTLSARF